jgi:hypothetical protein
MRDKMLVAVTKDGRVLGVSKKKGEAAKAMDAETAARAARRVVSLWRSTS